MDSRKLSRQNALRPTRRGTSKVFPKPSENGLSTYYNDGSSKSVVRTYEEEIAEVHVEYNSYIDMLVGGPRFTRRNAVDLNDRKGEISDHLIQQYRKLIIKETFPL